MIQSREKMRKVIDLEKERIIKILKQEKIENGIMRIECSFVTHYYAEIPLKSIVESISRELPQVESWSSLADCIQNDNNSTEACLEIPNEVSELLVEFLFKRLNDSERDIVNAVEDLEEFTVDALDGRYIYYFDPKDGNVKEIK